MQEIAPRGLPKNRAINIGCTTLLVATFLVAVVLAASGYALPNSAAGGMSHTYVCLTAQDLVKRQLKAPSTASFASCAGPDTFVVESSDHKWTVTSYVDAQNGFGAIIRNDYVAQMTYNPSTQVWTLTNLHMDSR